jgi:hypothetical protein
MKRSAKAWGPWKGLIPAILNRDRDAVAWVLASRRLAQENDELSRVANWSQLPARDVTDRGSSTIRT